MAPTIAHHDKAISECARPVYDFNKNNRNRDTAQAGGKP
jgi:hypothetical protein